MQSKHFAAVVKSRPPAFVVIRGARRLSTQSDEIPDLRFSDVGRVGLVRREIMTLSNESR